MEIGICRVRLLLAVRDAELPKSGGSATGGDSAPDAATVGEATTRALPAR